MSFLLWLVLGRKSPHRGRKRVGMAFICAIKEIRHFYGNVLIVCRPSLSLYCDYRTWTNSRDTGYYCAKSTQKAATGTHSHCADTDYILKEIVLVASTAYHQTNYPSVLTVPQSGFPGVHQTLLSQRILCGCVDDGRELRQCWWWIFHCH